MKTLTIITTTYNRAYCIGQVYESLKRQDCDDFCWLVIDDGSADNTREVIEGFIAEGKVEIEYIYQNNKGMTGARNTAYNACHTELNTIIDSDDWLADGAVRRIIDFWNANKRDDLAGIMALDVNPAGEVIGTEFPEGLTVTTVMEAFGKYKIRGDKKLVYRTDLAKLYPYPENPGENFFPPSYKFFQIDLTHKLLVLNEGICVVDYNDDSMSFNKIAQYKRCPLSFAEYYNVAMKCYPYLRKRMKNAILYIAISKLGGRSKIISTSTQKLLTICMFPFGVGLAYYLRRTNRNALSVPKKYSDK